MKLTGAFLLVCGVLAAQGSQNQPIYRVTVTARTAKAISYQHRSGSTKVDFRGTDLLPSAHGEAKVDSKQGRMAIEVEFDGLQPATKNGSEYLTYVLWAITPEGRTANLGEVLLNGSKSKMEVTTDLQVFGLIVTAEPYYAVRQPSDMIVMENVVRTDTVGKVEQIDAKYELLKRGEYERLSNPLSLKMDRKLPLELYEARNAVQIARAIGAAQFASETFQKAEKNLSQAEAYQSRNAGWKPVSMSSREAVQMAEDSRAIAVKRQEDDALATERLGSAARENRAIAGQAAAESETDRVSRDAEAARIRARADSERLTREKEAQGAASSAEADRLKRESDSRLAVVVAGADRQKMDSDLRMAGAAAEVDRLKNQNDADRASSQAALDDAAKQTAQLQTERVELRTLLLSQFNAILQTRDTARGLVVNMSDVLFDTGKSTLRPLAREKLAKVAGIVSGHPGLRLDVEGYTDSVGGDDYNQQLSEERGNSVRDYLMHEGMSTSAVSSKGFGKTQPVATNDTAEGRQQNRRVELVISGKVIGSEIGTPIANR
jgi:outer membrane protein OmpA-like peptidoglycan-associated protein